MKIKPIVKGISHTGIRITVAEKNIELTRHKLNRWQREKEKRNAKVNHFHLNTPLANTVLKTTWNKEELQEDKEYEFKKRKKGLTIGKLMLDWDFKKNNSNSK